MSSDFFVQGIVFRNNGLYSLQMTPGMKMTQCINV